MLNYPMSTTREEKFILIEDLKNRLLNRYKDNILAIGVYGSIGQEIDGPYSDIEMHVITENDTKIDGHEFIFGKFKMEIDTDTKDEIFNEARKVDDMWPIKAGSFIHILPIYDPNSLFEELKTLPLSVSKEDIESVMREFMIWEPYETMGKVRNNWLNGNHDYLTIAARDLIWQTAKLIGLANKQYYSTRAKMFQESLLMSSKPSGYEELVQCVLKGNLTDKQKVYALCENLWSGLNEWFEELGIEYRANELPF